MSIKIFIILISLVYSVAAYAGEKREYAKRGEGRLLPRKMTSEQMAIKKRSR